MVHVLFYGQTIFDVGAIVESDSHLWTLRTIERHKDCLAVIWQIKNKKPNTVVEIDSTFIELRDLHTGSHYKPTKLSQKAIMQHTSYETDSLRILFPLIKDTLSLISISLLPKISVDSIILPSSYFETGIDSITLSNSLLGMVRYKIQYIYKPLYTRSDSIAFSDSLFNKGMYLYEQQDYQEATICFEKCYAFDKLLDNYVPFFSSLKKREFNDYSRMWLARCLYMIGEEEKAKAMDSDYMLKPFDRKLVEKSDSIYNVVNNYSYKPISEAEHILAYNRMCEYDSISLGVNHQRYALSLYDLGRIYSSYRKFADAKTVLNRSYDIMSCMSKDNWLVQSILDELAKIAYEEEDYLSAIRYKEQSLGIANGHCDFSKESFLSTNYSTLAHYYMKVGDWDKGLYIQRNKKLYWEKLYKSNINSYNEWQYLSALNTYASFLANTGRYKDALRVYKELIEIDHSKWRLTDLGTYYYNIRDYRSALNCYLEAINDSSTLSVENCLNSLAICYSALGDNKKAIQTQKECIAKTNPSELSYSNVYNGFASYTTELSNLASFFNRNEQYDSALVYERKSLELKNRYFSSHSDDIAYSYMNMGIALGGKGQWRKAIDKLLFSYDIYKKQPQRKYYHRVLSYLAKYSFSLSEYNDLNRFISEYMRSASEDLLSTFQELTYDERSRYVEEYSDLMNHQVPVYAYCTNSDSLIATAFNASLMMKGALLSSENGVKRVIEESKDAALMDLWEELRADRYILSKCFERDSTETSLNVDSLQRVINKMEDSLIVRCKEYGDITQSMKLKWQDVQKTLHPEDIAIEFLSFPINNDSVMYVALTLHKGFRSPKMITLFEEKQLMNVSDTVYYQCKDMTDLVWGRLLPELKGIKNIYYSPTGALYNIGIEYLPGMENYNIFRLSSTRELVENKGKTKTGKNAVLYGGLDYNTSIDSLTRKKSLTVLNETFKEHADVRGLGLRGGKEPLEHTKIEVDKIGEELSRAKWVCLLDTASLGTEESFKSLSGRKINCLHLSTHGFYYTKEEADNAQYNFMLIDDHVATTAEDKALTRSGLILSGANHILEGDTLPDNVEDGILTAKEIADVDLRGLDLVVLSACQTGLGDISQGEGVFGLQRGFKKAGANTILMSLWEVNDEATQILMTQFYKSLVSGQSKRHSLLSAQDYLRKYDGGKYNEPKYWAAFILLDGID